MTVVDSQVIEQQAEANSLLAGQRGAAIPRNSY